MVAQLAAIENQGEAEAAQLVAVNKVDPVIIAPSLLFMIANINNYTTGGNGAVTTSNSVGCPRTGSKLSSKTI